jgi:XapX domain-containing protein
MKPYILSLCAGLLVGAVYSFLGVRSPAPPAVALIGLLGILLGEQLVPIASRFAHGRSVVAFLHDGGRSHVLGHMPSNRTGKDA